MANGGPLGLLDGGIFQDAQGKFTFPFISGAVAGIMTKVTEKITDKFTEKFMGRLSTRLDNIMAR